MKLIKDFPFVRQNTDWTCGPVAVKAVLRYFGINKSEIRLVDELGCTTEHGTDFDKVVTYFKGKGFKVTARKTTLPKMKDFVRRNIPCLVCIQAWNENPDIDYTNAWEDGHFIVVIGYDNDNVVYEDPSIHKSGERGVLSNREFLKRWHDIDSKRKPYVHYMIAVEETTKKAKPRAKLQRNRPRRALKNKTA